VKTDAGEDVVANIEYIEVDEDEEDYDDEGSDDEWKDLEADADSD
jgi:hypothetical protein